MKGLKYISWNDTSGYAVASHRYIRGLIEQDIPLTWTPMIPGSSWGSAFGYEPFTGTRTGRQEFDPVCNKSMAYDTVLIHLVPEYFPRWIAQEPGKRHIGYTTWETDKIPDHWPEILNRLDRVWVPSTWNKEVFEGSGVTVPIDVIPHILAPAPGPDARVAHPLMSQVPPENYVFYSVNVWSRRKALWLLLEAYWSAFQAHEPVSLVLKTSRNDGTSRYGNKRFPLSGLARTSRTYRKLEKRYPHKPSTILIAEENTPQPMIDMLHHRCDCYVSLSRAEGWGLGAFDAVAAGNPVIMTGYGGQTDFLPKEHAGLVDYNLIPVADAMNKKSYSPDQRWGDPDIQQAGQLMRSAFENPAAARANGQHLLDDASDHFNQQSVIQKILEILNDRG